MSNSFETPWTAACQASLSITNSRACSNSCPLSQWCYPTISSSVVPFSSCLQPFPASGSFQMSQVFTSGGQIIGVSASLSVIPMNSQDWFPLGQTGWISLQSKGLLSPTPQSKSISSSALSFLYGPTLTLYTTTGKTRALTRWTFVHKVLSLLFIMLFRLVITFLPRSKHLLISWLQSPSIVILKVKVKVKSLSRVRLCDPVDCSPPGSSVHEILQARILEWVAISFSRGSSWLRDRTQVSCIAGRCFTLWATPEK